LPYRYLVGQPKKKLIARVWWQQVKRADRKIEKL